MADTIFPDVALGGNAIACCPMPLNAEFLIFSLRSFAASVIAGIWQCQISNSAMCVGECWIFSIFTKLFCRWCNCWNLALLDLGILTVTCPCECQICECQIFGIFTKVFCRQCKWGNLAVLDLGILARWLARFLIFSRKVFYHLPLWMPDVCYFQ